MCKTGPSTVRIKCSSYPTRRITRCSLMHHLCWIPHYSKNNAIQIRLPRWTMAEVHHGLSCGVSNDVSLLKKNKNKLGSKETSRKIHCECLNVSVRLRQRCKTGRFVRKSCISCGHLRNRRGSVLPRALWLGTTCNANTYNNISLCIIDIDPHLKLNAPLPALFICPDSAEVYCMSGHWSKIRGFKI